MAYFKQVANWTALYLDWLNSELDLDFSTLHLTGHSLGGQIAGIIGHNMVNGKPGRVTGTYYSTITLNPLVTDSLYLACMAKISVKKDIIEKRFL